MLANIIVWIATFGRCLLVEADALAITWDNVGNYFQGANKPAIAKPGETIQIICPRTETTHESGRQQYDNVWKVNRVGYDNCDATNGTLMALCEWPGQDLRVDLPIVPRQGETMYFVSTANGNRDSLMNRKGGMCKRFNKKLIVYVQEREG